jgi:hypothetical protein
MAITVSGTTLTFNDATTQTTAGLTGSSDQLAKAWVRFTGATVNASYNVSSITNASTGRYIVNFTNALTDTNYCPVIGTQNTVTNPGGNNIFEGVSASTTSAFHFSHYEGANLQNSGTSTVAVFR